MNVLDDPLAYINRNPHMFLRSSTVHGAELASLLATNVLILVNARVVTFRDEPWWVIASDADWIGSDTDFSLKSLFHRIVPFPQAGPNSMRAEVLLTAFADDVITQGSSGLHVIKGNAARIEAIWTTMSSDPAWRRVVAFRLGDV